MARTTSPTILPDHASLHLVRLEADEQFILAVVAPTALEALCPLCQCRCESIHSRYVRLVADLPWAGWAVRLELPVRRFFCQKREGRRQIFTERLPSAGSSFCSAYPTSDGSFHAHRVCGWRGEAGKRLVDGMG
jgi:transposase